MSAYFQILAAKQALGTAELVDFTDWAESLLDQGCELQSVAILASLGLEQNADIQEVERYFTQCVAELGLVLPDAQAAIWMYAQLLAKSISIGSLKPSTGLGLLKSFWIATNYSQPLYTIWYELAVDVYSLEHQAAYLWNAELSETNIEEFIVNVAQQFLQLSQTELPDNFFNLTACVDCGHVGLAVEQRVELPWLAEPVFRLLYGRNPTMQAVCSHCASSHIKGMRDYQGRTLYLTSKQIIENNE